MILKFGSYRGKSIDDVLHINTEYVIWLASISKTVKGDVGDARDYALQLISKADGEQSFVNLCRSRLKAMAPVIAIIQNVLVLRALKHGRESPWLVELLENYLKKGYIPAERARSIIADICAKTFGRRNSKKYSQISKEIQDSFAAALNIQHERDGVSDSI